MKVYTLEQIKKALKELVREEEISIISPNEVGKYLISIKRILQEQERETNEQIARLEAEKQLIEQKIHNLKAW